jgi:cytochrome b
MNEKIRTNKTNPVKVNYLVDLAIFVAFLISLDPRATGMTIHEWLGIAFGAAVIVHLLLHWKWVAASTRRFLGKLPRATRLNYVLNTLLFIAMTTIVYSGLMISEIALPALGISLGEGFSWRMLHAQASDITLILIGLHIAFHWKWILSTTKRYVVNPVTSRRTRLNPVAPPSIAAELKAEEVGI